MVKNTGPSSLEGIVYTTYCMLEGLELIKRDNMWGKLIPQNNSRREKRVLVVVDRGMVLTEVEWVHVACNPRGVLQIWGRRDRY